MSCELMHALKAVLTDGLAEIRMPRQDSEEYVTPTLFLGAVPPANQGGSDREVYPFVLLRWIGSNDPADGSGRCEEKILCIVGVYGEAGPQESEEWTVTLVRRIRSSLLAASPLAGRFELAGPIKAKADDPAKQQNHYQLAMIETVWSAPSPVLSMDPEHSGAGYPA